MKKFKNLFAIVATLIVLCVSSVAFTACGNETTYDPKLTLEQAFQTTYSIGASLDVSNGKIKYVDEKGEETITEVNENMISDFSTATAGRKTMKLTYNSLTINIDYVVTQTPEISIEHAFKTTYNLNEALDVTSGQLRYVDQYGDFVVVPIQASMISYFSTENIGQKTMQLTYNGLTIDINYTVTIPNTAFLPENWQVGLGGSQVESITFETQAPADYEKTTTTLDDGRIEVWKKGTSHIALVSEYTITSYYGLEFSSFKNLKEVVLTNLAVYTGSAKYMFSGCTNLTSVTFSEKFTTLLTDISSMFDRCTSLTSIDLTGLDTSTITDMQYLFSGCTALSEITLPAHFAANAVDITGMFSGCESLTTIDLTNLDTQNVTRIGYLFSNCAALESITFPQNFAANAINMQNMFERCHSLVSLDLTNLDTSKVVSMRNMFNMCDALTTITLPENFAANVNDFGWMFSGCDALTALTLTNLSTSSATSMQGMFSYCSQLGSIDFTEQFDTSKVTDMSEMFAGCIALTSLDLSGFDTSNVTTMRGMFLGCEGFTTLDISSFDTAKVTDMSIMFADCSNLATLYIGEGFSTQSVESDEDIFDNCPCRTVLVSEDE